MAESSRKSWVWAVVALVLLTGGYWWWQSGGTELTITGEATIEAAPDEYQFSPSYEEEGTDQTAIRASVTKTGNEVVAGLKELGVEASKLKTDVSVRGAYRGFPTDSSEESYVATYTITAVIEDAERAKQVQEYLATTPVTGSVTPYSTFSDTKRKELEREVRKLALEDAQLQAEDTAETLGVRILSIESIGSPQWGGPIPFSVGARSDMVTTALPELESPEFLVGEQEVSYQIQVVYRVR